MRGRALSLALVALLAAALVGQTLRGWSHVRSTALLGAVRQQMMAAQRLGLVPGPLLRAAGAAIGEAERLDPVAIEPRAFRGDLLLLAGRHAEAAAAYERAAAHEVRPEILAHHGLALWHLGRREEAVVQMRRAVAIAPRLYTSFPPAALELLPWAGPEPLPPAVGSPEAATPRAR